MLNRQIGILFLVGILIAVTASLATSLVPFPAKLEATTGLSGLLLRGLLVASLFVVGASQVFVTLSALRTPAQPSSLRINKTMELLWSLLPGALLLGAIAYALTAS